MYYLEENIKYKNISLKISYHHTIKYHFTNLFRKPKKRVGNAIKGGSIINSLGTSNNDAQDIYLSLNFE